MRRRRSGLQTCRSYGTFKEAFDLLTLKSHFRRGRMIRSIGTKLALKISIALIIVMALFGVWDVFQRREQLRTLLYDKQKRIGQQLGLLLGELLYNFSEEQIENAFRSYLADPDILSLKILKDESVLEYLGVDPETQEILNLAAPESTTPHYEYAEKRQSPVMYMEEELGSFEIVFSQRFIIDHVEHIILKVCTNILLVIIIGTIVVLILARRDISTPLLEIAQVACRIAEGDLSIHIRSGTSQDEIGTLSRSFTSMTSYLQTMADIAKNISKGDLRDEMKPRSNNDILGQAFLNMSLYLDRVATAATMIASGDLRVNIELNSEYDVLGTAFQQMKFLRQLMSDIMEAAAQLRSSSELLHEVSTTMASSTKQISQQIHTVAENSRQVSENIEAVAISTEQFSSNIREISKNTTEVADIVNSAVAISSTADTTMAELENQTQEIGDIIAIINAITQQTNLLGLNAIIEAAHAGNFGKGFAVVAHEMKELSKETAFSAEGIIHNVESIQSKSRDMREAMNKMSEIITRIRNFSDSVATGVEEQSFTTQEIAHRITEAANGSREITTVTAEVATAAQNTSNGAAMVQRSASELTSLADHLQQLVGRFHI